ncbi:prephenate dehydrogenase [Actinoplanes sp. NBRC 101535]|uniref:prephenate dehydrogenase n=1 Tax=Actinoplanes sp. NBRC 101535 TaxID=3032196 RepID=UPI0024A19C18|nr:prephenate dehydrogenase [Actinoplanes sp. NBRC 101535]GLY02194.1 prephenate dehydrogenase [Actinoplanes sp. NBRC 101535]
MIRSLLVIGTGLIGTSVALAARRRGVEVFLADRDVAAARIAEALGAGRAEPPGGPVDLALVAVPPAQVATVLRDTQTRRSALSYTDVAGVKGALESDVLRLAPDPVAYAGGHPMAGRERSGPLAASADLFHGRTWVLTPHDRTGDAALDRVTALAGICGATPVRLDGRTHDIVVALTSHVPHLMASLTAARLREGPAATEALAGQGVRDVTRIAAGDPTLWTDIVRANAPAIAAVLRDVRDDLTRLLAATEALADRDAPGHTAPGHAETGHTAPGHTAPDRAGTDQDAARDAVTELLRRGVTGAARTRPPTGPAGGRTRIRVVLDRRPGRLGELLDAVAARGGDVTRADADLTPDGLLTVDLEIGTHPGSGSGSFPGTPTSTTPAV